MKKLTSMNQNIFPKLAKGLRLFYCAALMAVLAVNDAPVSAAHAAGKWHKLDEERRFFR